MAFLALLRIPPALTFPYLEFYLMTLKHTFLACTLFLGCSLSAAEVRLSVQGASDYAIRHNPGLVAARYQIDEAKARRYGVGRFSNPEFEVEHLQSTSSAERSTGIRLEQRFPVTARLRLEKRIADAQIEAARAEVRNAERQVAKEAQEAAVKLLALRERVKIAKGQASNSGELANFLQRRVESGEVSNLDALQVDLESQQLETEVVELETQEALLLGELRIQLGVSHNTRIVLQEQLAPVAPGGMDWRERPDLLAARIQADAAIDEIGLARANRWEDWTLSLKGEFSDEIDEPDGLEDEQFIGVSVKVPLPVWNDNKGKIRETSAAAKRKEAEVASIENKVANEAGAALQEMQAHARLLRAIDGSLSAKAATFEQLVKQAYEAGQASLQDSLRARERNLAIQRRRIDALENYQLARVRYLAATGAILPAQDLKR